ATTHIHPLSLHDALPIFTLTRSNDILAGALQGGVELDRRALLALLEEHGISTEGQRGVYLLQRASLDGLIAQGVQRGQYGTFFRSEEHTSELQSRENLVC